MKTEEELAWEWRTRTVWIVLAVFYTIWPCVPFVSGELARWLGAPHTWGGRIATWSIAAFCWVLCIIRPTRRSLPLTGAVFVSIGEAALILDRLGIIRDGSARATSLELIGMGALAALFWFWHVRSRMVAQR